MTIELDDLDDFTRAYVECALWSSNDNADESGGEPLDKGRDASDVAQDSLVKMVEECKDFREANAELLAQAGDDSQNGRDFWLTRNGHGGGFWDRGHGTVGDELTKAAKVYGSRDLYVGDDGKVYQS